MYIYIPQNKYKKQTQREEIYTNSHNILFVTFVRIKLSSEAERQRDKETKRHREWQTPIT